MESQIAEIPQEKSGHTSAEDGDGSRQSFKVLLNSVALSPCLFKEVIPSEN